MTSAEVTRAKPSPSAFLGRFAHLLKPGATVLDVASGDGPYVAWLQALGLRVTAIDRDAAALQRGGADEQVVADLEDGAPPLIGRQFDVIIVTNYLHRPLWAQIQAWMAPDGCLFYETFCVGQEAFGRPRRAEFLLRPGELLEAFARLSVVVFEQGIEGVEHVRAVQRLAARKSDALCLLSGITAPSASQSRSPPQIR